MSSSPGSTPPCAPCRRSERGLGLVETMLGLLIGLFAMAAIFHVIDLAQRSKSMTAPAIDAVASGGIAAYRLEIDMKHAGFGLGRLPASTLGCNVRGVDLDGAPFSFAFLPIAISEGAAGAPDEVRFLASSHTLLTSRVAFDGAPAATTRTLARSRAGFAEDDRLIAVGLAATPATCRYARVSAIPGGAPLDVEFASGVHNPPPGGLGSRGDLYDLGPSPRLAVWFVRDQRLFRANRLSRSAAEAAGFEVASGVVDFQAQYGLEPATGELLWCNAGDAACMGANDLSRVRSVRVAIVVRSDTMERDAVTPAAPRWTSAGVALYPGFAADPDAPKYRYRVYEASVPSRNLIWSAP